jgi:hypothetical protein
VSGWWTDAGTIPSLYHATQLVAAAENAPVLRVPEVGGGRLGPTAYRLTWTMARRIQPTTGSRRRRSAWRRSARNTFSSD